MSSNLPLAEELAARYTRLFETAQDGILILDYPDGIIEDANPFIVQLIGFTKEELVGKKLWEIGLIADKEKALAAHRSILEHGYVRYEDIDLVTKNGVGLPTEFICNSYLVGEKTVIQCNIRDISARKKAEHALTLEQTLRITQIYETVNSLSNVIEARDPFTAGHQRRVADLSVEIAKELGMQASDIDGLKLAALIHDVGKIGIPVEVLTKPTALSPLEVAILRSHAQAGYDILKPLSFPWPIAKFVLQHHERLNGSGYPNGLRNEQICLEARILAVADTVEAMASDRPYRPKLGIEAGLEEISNKSGVLYDPIVVKACLTLFRERSYKLLEVAGGASTAKNQVRG
jgi:PAS domain S-box-containing protein/putative nucleotidyltransferase with HDIG domain